MAVEDQGEDKR